MSVDRLVQSAGRASFMRGAADVLKSIAIKTQARTKHVVDSCMDGQLNDALDRSHRTHPKKNRSKFFTHDYYC